MPGLIVGKRAGVVSSAVCASEARSCRTGRQQWSWPRCPEIAAAMSMFDFDHANQLVSLQADRDIDACLPYESERRRRIRLLRAGATSGFHLAQRPEARPQLFREDLAAAPRPRSGRLWGAGCNE